MLNNTQKTLNKFVKKVIEDAKKNLQADKKNASGNLTKSLKGEAKQMPNSIGIYFDLGKYGDYVDKGVSGTEKKYNTPYKYTNKMPPPKAFDKWIVRRGLARVKGKFTSRKGLQFAIAKSIQKKGLKPSNFFSKALEKNFKILEGDIVKSYGLDIEYLVDSTIIGKRK